MSAKFFPRSIIAYALTLLALVVTTPMASGQSSITGSYAFNWRADKTDSNISLSGSVPSEQIQRFLIIRAGKSVSSAMQVARGAPENFISSSIAGLDALKHLESGSFFLADDVWTLSGNTSSDGQKDDLIAVLAHAIDIQDWTIEIDVTEMAVEPAQVAQDEMPKMPVTFRWAVQRDLEGAFRFSGNVPSEELQNFLGIRAKQVARDISQVSEGAPAGFMTSALASIEALKDLKTGRVVFANGLWTIYGLAPDQTALSEAMSALKSVQETQNWAISIKLADIEVAEITELVEPEPTPEPEPAPEPEPTPEPAPQPIVEPAPKIKPAEVSGNPNYQFNALRADGGVITLSGMLPANSFANYISRLAEGASAESLVILSDEPTNFRINAITGTKALSQLHSGLLAYENGVWTLVGDALDQTTRAQVKQQISELVDSENWILDIATVPTLEICRISVAQFAQTKTILFAPASANLTAQSKQNVQDLASTLNNCAEAIVRVAGHTDADGPADDNMALSVARAESVVNALIDAGVDISRLYAIGYGETLPIATNDTRAGKTQNRRIVFELSEE